MSQLIRSRRRLLPFIRNYNSTRPFSFTATISPSTPPPPPPPPAVATAAASSTSIAPPTPPAAAAAEAGSSEPSKPWSLLKIGAFTAITAALSAAAYATYAYSLEEVGQKAKALNAMSNYTVGDIASNLEKFQAMVYTTAVKGLGEDRCLVWVEGDAESLSFEDGSMDGYTICIWNQKCYPHRAIPLGSLQGT